MCVGDAGGDDEADRDGRGGNPEAEEDDDSGLGLLLQERLNVEPCDDCDCDECCCSAGA